MSKSIIIAGGRDFDDYGYLSQTMDHLLSDVKDEVVIICGKAKGADTFGERYAIEHGRTVKYFPADWKRYGKAAGFMRNTEMARNADILVAFWDGKSSGTKHMIETAKSFGLTVHVKQY